MIDRSGVMDESEFRKQATETLRSLAERIEMQLGEDVDIDLRDGVLTLELADGRIFVVNRHQPNRQIWLASPISGAHHFGWAGGSWRSTRGESTLQAVLAADLDAAVGRGIALP